ncbi:hypothetical protein [Aliikangiella maris]|uniref:Uncharacterized protein n=2 Tax=Aliikangiella maris TaxID=3162458 RepID=A0ABV2BTM6_9GAMM
MFELIIGIILGATFHQFWRHLYQLICRQVKKWLADNQKSDTNTLP